jgi:uncharacterized protein
VEPDAPNDREPSLTAPGECPPDAGGVLTGPAPPLASPAPFLALDRRVIQLWRISGLLGCVIIAIPALVALLFACHSLLGNAILAFIPWSGVLLFGGLWSLWYPARAYRAWGYRVEDRVLEIRSGVWFRVVRFLPLSRLQHVDLHRGPLERAHGLASLTLHTAGTREASLGIPGLADAEAEGLRDRLAAAGGDDAV